MYVGISTRRNLIGQAAMCLLPASPLLLRMHGDDVYDMCHSVFSLLWVVRAATLMARGILTLFPFSLIIRLDDAFIFLSVTVFLLLVFFSQIFCNFLILTLFYSQIFYVASDSRPTKSAFFDMGKFY